MAVWRALAGHTVVDKVVAIVLPISAFVAAGFEHSVANFYYLPLAWLIHVFAPHDFWSASRLDPGVFAAFTVTNTLRTQSAVILGNVVGGACLIALVYWLAYLRPRRRE
jgi:formate transporter